MSLEIRPCKRLCISTENLNREPGDHPNEIGEDKIERVPVEQGYGPKDWADLNEDMLYEIFRRFKSLDDFCAFRGVCPNWRSAANLSAKNLSSLNPLVLVHIEVRRDLPHFPNFMSGRLDSNEVYEGDDNSESGLVSEGDEDSKSGQVSEGVDGLESSLVSETDDGSEADSVSKGDLISHDLPSFEVYLYDVIEKRFYQKPLSWSSWRTCNYINFDHGYLAMSFGNGYIQLRHILNGDIIWLPKTRRPFSDDMNIIFSGSPASPGCAFVLFQQYSPILEFCFPDYEFEWRAFSLSGSDLFMDMIFFNEKLYALIAPRYFPDNKQLVVIEFTPDITFTSLGMPVNFDRGTFLTSMRGQLLVYCGRFLAWDFGSERWIEDNNFDGRSIFVSNWQCHACMAPTPDSMVKPNHLYSYDTYNSVHFEVPMEENVESNEPEEAMEENVESNEPDYVDLLDLTDAGSLHIGRSVWILPGMCVQDS